MYCIPFTRHVQYSDQINLYMSPSKYNISSQAYMHFNHLSIHYSANSISSQGFFVLFKTYNGFTVTLIKHTLVAYQWTGMCNILFTISQRRSMAYIETCSMIMGRFKQPELLPAFDSFVQWGPTAAGYRIQHRLSCAQIEMLLFTDHPLYKNMKWFLIVLKGRFSFKSETFVLFSRNNSLKKNSSAGWL